MNHHPEILILYRKVIVTSTTHSAGKMITDQDIALANEINLIFKENY